MKFLQKTKAWAAQKAAREYLNRNFADVGSITDLKIDSVAKTIRVEAQLQGEDCPVTIEVSQYRLKESGGKLFVAVHKAGFSKEWMGRLFERFGKGVQFEVPKIVRHLL